MIATFIRNQLVGLGTALLIAHGALAQDDGANAEAGARQTLQIEVQNDTRLPDGKSAFIEGTTDAIGQKFLLEGTEVTQPIIVGVYTEHPDDDVRVQIVKDHWDRPEREASTAGSGKAEFEFRTFDGFKLNISAPQETAYQLVVWVGNEPPLAIPSIASPASTFTDPAASANADRDGPSASHAGISLSPLELALIGMLVLVGGVLVALLVRRKSS